MPGQKKIIMIDIIPNIDKSQINMIEVTKFENWHNSDKEPHVKMALTWNFNEWALIKQQKNRHG